MRWNSGFALSPPARWMAAGVLWACAVALVPTAAGGFVGFEYDPIAGDIESASFSLDVAELTAHRYVGETEVNRVILMDEFGVERLSLSPDLFGESEYPDPAQVALGTQETQVLTVAIDASFYPVLQSGRVGLYAMLTETYDSMFAIDSVWLTIETAGKSRIEPYYGSPNDGFLHGIPDNGSLPEPAIVYLPPGSTETGFDETIAAKVIIPEPGALALLVGVMLIVRARVRARS